MNAPTDRTWPLPKRPWVMRMTWSELLFAHWPVEPRAVARLLPVGLTLDTRDGLAWVVHRFSPRDFSSFHVGRRRDVADGLEDRFADFPRLYFCGGLNVEADHCKFT